MDESSAKGAVADESSGRRLRRDATITESPSYKWVALSNTTIGILMATINSSILLIALPDIFRGIHVNPLAPSNTSLFLWILMGYMVVTAVLVVSFGRIGDMYGRARMYNLGFAVFTGFSILLAATPLGGTGGALWLIVMRIGQGIGGAFLFANSSAIITDAFPENQRGLALGINNVAGIAGSFIGLILGGLLGPIEWRLVFLVSVPIGLGGTIWAYMKLPDIGARIPSKIDWWGNLTFAIGLISILVGITYGLLPYGGHTMGWTNPGVLAALFGGAMTLVVFAWIETKVENPMFRLRLFRIRAFAAGNFASLLASLGRGGLMFILIIWLQGIWLPQHGYSFSQTPLWAGIYMLPLTAGFLISGPLSGFLSDHFGARPFATGGMILAALSFGLLETLPANFSYLGFAALILLNGLAMGLFASPNRAGIMNSLPPTQRGAGAGMVATFQNAAMVLSIGIFFTLMIFGLKADLPAALSHGLVAQGVPAAAAAKVAAIPPVSTLFAAFLGYNPMRTLLGSKLLSRLPASHASYITGRSFFPQLISKPFAHGLAEAFTFALVACLLAAGASWLRGGKYYYRDDSGEPAPMTTSPTPERAERSPEPLVGSSRTAPAGSGEVIPTTSAAIEVALGGARPDGGLSGGTASGLPGPKANGASDARRPSASGRDALGPA